MPDFKIEQLVEINKSADGVCCDGGGDLGHPKTYYEFDGNNCVTCRYCNRIFTKSS